MVNDCIQYDISKWGNSSHKLKKTKKNLPYPEIIQIIQ